MLVSGWHADRSFAQVLKLAIKSFRIPISKLVASIAVAAGIIRVAVLNLMVLVIVVTRVKGNTRQIKKATSKTEDWILSRMLKRVLPNDDRIHEWTRSSKRLSDRLKSLHKYLTRALTTSSTRNKRCKGVPRQRRSSWGALCASMMLRVTSAAPMVCSSSKLVFQHLGTADLGKNSTMGIGADCGSAETDSTGHCPRKFSQSI